MSSCSSTSSAPFHSHFASSRSPIRTPTDQPWPPRTPNSNRPAMAPADAGDFLLDQDDDDFFGEYNPHPYQGGYDLAATFGTPLPPSANICYPISSSSFPAAAAPITPSPPTPTPEPADPPPVERDEKAPPREPVRESPEVFPNGAVTERKVRKGGWRRRFLKKCVRALDYIFGYKDPYAEQRIGVDNYVVPVYANRKESGDDALAVEVEVPPPSVGRVEPHDGSEELVQSNDLPWHSNYRNDADTYSLSMSYPYYMPSFAQYYGLPGVLGKPDWFPNSSYSESHQVEEFQHEALLSYNVEHMTSGQPIHCYHHHHCEQPLNVQVEPPEPVSSQRLENYEHFPTYCDQSGAHILETPAHAYNIQSYTPISDVPLEPFRPSWSQNWGLYDAYMQRDALENDTHSLISGEYGGIGSLFISPFYPRETETFEQAPSDEHASFQHNLSYRNMPMDDFSLITHLDGDSYSVNGSFWPFGGHSAYRV